MNKYKCILCKSNNIKNILIIKNKEYFLCENCNLIFVPKKFHLSKKEEFNRYKLHNNNLSDEKYKNFLNQLIEPLETFISKNSKGLDFGCGDTPVLSMMLQEKNINMDIYDLYFHDDKNVFNNKYDFVVASETVEHFKKPFLEFKKINSILKENGYFAIMTGMIDSWDMFEKWHYKSDSTHVTFYSKDTFNWIANKFHWEIIFTKKNIVIFKKYKS